MTLEQKCKEAGIHLGKTVTKEKWRKRVELRRKYRWYYKLKTEIILLLTFIK